MRCPFCRSRNDRVLDSATRERTCERRRRRLCRSCQRRFNTTESVADVLCISHGIVSQAHECPSEKRLLLPAPAGAK